MDKRSELLEKIANLKLKIKELEKNNAELEAMVEQVRIENLQLKQFVRERLEETQMLRGITG